MNGRATRRSVLAGLLLAVTCGALRASGEPAPRAMPPLRVLFVGNSYTFVNDLPGMFARLAAAGGFEVQTAMVAPGGWTLAQHAASAETLQAIRGTRWHYVVLQEQSVVPAVERERAEHMVPAVRTLAREIADSGGAPLLYMTWGRRDGLPSAGYGDFAAMQSALSEAFVAIARELGIGLAPVGAAWREAHARDPRIDLWQSDGSHPTVEGTYLAACVFYATMFKRSPVGLAYVAGLPAEQARVLQSVATDVTSRQRSR
jgi:hypothetical protein